MAADSRWFRLGPLLRRGPAQPASCETIGTFPAFAITSAGSTSFMRDDRNVPGIRDRFGGLNLFHEG